MSALLILAFLSIVYKNHSLIYLPPVLISLMILFPFARSVGPGYIPLLTQFYYLAEGVDKHSADPKRIHYTHVLTWFWLGLMTLMLLEILILSFFAPLTVWSLFTNFINYFILLLFMIMEWLFRNMYFKQWSSPIVFIKQLIMIDHQKLLQKET